MLNFPIKYFRDDLNQQTDPIDQTYEDIEHLDEEFLEENNEELSDDEQLDSRIIRGSRSYTLEFKSKKLKAYHASKMTRQAFARSIGVSFSTFQQWVATENKLKEICSKKGIKTRKIRKVPGSGRKAFFPELEQQVFEWVRECNSTGLRVKDKYIIAKALSIYNTVAPAKPFIASKHWCQRFKKRHNLVSRRVTSCTKLPDNYEEIAVNFIRKVQTLIKTYNIQLENVINLDQIPRYFETENKMTITLKGLKHVNVRKGSTSHKRFTVTPIISAAGTFITTHLLFKDYKNLPKFNRRSWPENNGIKYCYFRVGP